MPPRAQAIIVFAHDSGRRSPRNLQVAHALNEQRLGTLLFDLLRPEEALDRANVFDIELLGRRVTDVIESLAARTRKSWRSTGARSANRQTRANSPSCRVPPTRSKSAVRLSA